MITVAHHDRHLEKFDCLGPVCPGPVVKLDLIFYFPKENRVILALVIISSMTEFIFLDECWFARPEDPGTAGKTQLNELNN